jgi:hypothetical protein
MRLVHFPEQLEPRLVDYMESKGLEQAHKPELMELIL